MDFGQALGATKAATAQKISIYLPNKDQRGEAVARIEEWIEVTLAEMIEACGGATLVAPAHGAWKAPGGLVVRESTQVIYSFIRQPDVFVARLERITALLHSFGKFTNQGEVMVELGSESKEGYLWRAYYIEHFARAFPKNPLTQGR